jgi:hypothetical protein
MIKTDSNNTRFSNWEIVGNYLLHLNNYEEVFKCFNFQTPTLDKKLTMQFDKFLKDIKLPTEYRQFCGIHCGCEPGLGRILDQMVFAKLYVDYIEDNMYCHPDDRILITNELINETVTYVIQNAKDSDLERLKKKSSQKKQDYKTFQYSKTCCYRFINRWNIPSRYTLQIKKHVPKKEFTVELSSYALQNGYPVDGWPDKQYDSIDKEKLEGLRYSDTLIQMGAVVQATSKISGMKRKFNEGVNKPEVHV